MTKMTTVPENYNNIRAEIVELLKAARSTAARNVNSIMTATYWEIGRRIVKSEQGGAARANYGDELIKQLANDLSAQFGRGFGVVNLSQMRRFFLAWPAKGIFQTPSEKSSTPMAINDIGGTSPSIPVPANQFPLPWSAYVRLLSVKKQEARTFYETEALRLGWSVRQLDRQIASQFYERIALSQNKAAMLQKVESTEPADFVTPEESIKDPFVLEFLDLKDEYSESDLEEALIQHLTDFLLELGDDFAFLGRQRRLRIDDNWFRIDLIFFHRRLRCLLIADLKVAAAIAYLGEALRHAEIINNKNAIPQFQSELSDLYRLTGNLSEAEVLGRRAAESAQALGYIPMIPKLLNVLAQIQISQKEYAEAGQTYDRAAAIQDVMIGNADSAIGKTALIKGVGDLYAKHFGLIAEHGGDPAKAFTVVERARGRVMTDLLMSGDKTSPESLATEKNIARLRLRLTAAHSDEDIEKLRDQIFLAEQSRSVTPEVSILKAREHQVITVRQLQDSLSISEALLEYVVDDPASYCLVITRTSIRIVKLPGKQAISSLAIPYLDKLKGKERAQDEARHLYDVLLGGIPQLQDAKQLIIVRDGQLHLVPFDALVEPSGRYVVESRAVVYAPSATSFFLLRTASKRKSSAQGLLAAGGVPYQQSGTGLGDLPSSRDEARGAAAALPNRSNALLLGNEATETAFKKSVNHRIIHLAVHAIANDRSPDQSAFVLLKDPQHGEDGFLYPSEIVQLPLDADLVVLSACDTAVGPVEGEEGISTLARAFLLAGSRTVVSTLWTIDDDSTLYLMKVFYAELARHKSAPEALRVAKRRMLKDFGPRKAVPYFWAGLTVEGLAPPPPIEQ